MTDYELLETMRSEIQAELTLLSHRMSWYATSQSFLMSAYAIAWGIDHARAWDSFFRHGMPAVGILLSICAWLGIFAAVRVQAHVINSQTVLLAKMRARFETAKDTDALAGLDYYAGTTCAGRASKSSYHWMAMVPPCVVPWIFGLTWLVAWLISVFNK